MLYIWSIYWLVKFRFKCIRKSYRVRSIYKKPVYNDRAIYFGAFRCGFNIIIHKFIDIKDWSNIKRNWDYGLLNPIYLWHFFWMGHIWCVDMKIAILDKFSQYKMLYPLATFYICMILISDLYESKIIHVLFLQSGSGIILFSSTFFILGVISYIYDVGIARIVIIMGMLFCLLFFLIALVSEYLYTDPVPLPFLSVLDTTKNIFLATAISGFMAENINAHLVGLLKKRIQNFPALCLLLSILISSGISMSLFMPLAFGSRVGISMLLSMTLSSWLYRFMTEALITIPFAKIMINKITQIEGMQNV